MVTTTVHSIAGDALSANTDQVLPEVAIRNHQHVARQPNCMGAHLAARYGDAMRVIGFSLGDGDFTAVGPHGLASYPAVAPQPGTLEEVFRATAARFEILTQMRMYAHPAF